VPEEINESCREVVELITSKLGVKIVVINAFLRILNQVIEREK
jgi:hypothetical protein